MSEPITWDELWRETSVRRVAAFELSTVQSSSRVTTAFSQSGTTVRLPAKKCPVAATRGALDRKLPRQAEMLRPTTQTA